MYSNDNVPVVDNDLLNICIGHFGTFYKLPSLSLTGLYLRQRHQAAEITKIVAILSHIPVLCRSTF